MVLYFYLLMLNIIQEIAKIINNRLTSDFLWGFASICLLFIGYFIGLSDNYYSHIPATELIRSGEGYIDGDVANRQSTNTGGLIFGSKKGKYYYYEGCGGTNISKKNLVYYKSEAEAEKMGKTLYKSCQ